MDESNAIVTIKTAIKSGINYIDTAPWYGQGKSEEILGKALKEIPRDTYYIGTKIGRYCLEVEKQFDFSAKKTRESIEKSLKLLGLNYIDIIQIHDIEFAPSLDIIINETLPVLEEFVKDGRARFIGLTGYPLIILKQAILSAPGRFDTVLSYTRNTIIDDSLKEYMPFFLDQNLGVICASSHAMGLLTNSGPQAWHPASEDIKEFCRELSTYCKENDIELGKLALYHALNNIEGPTTYLVGMQTQNLLDINLDVVFNGISKKELNVLNTIKSRYLSKLKNHHWEGIEVERYKITLKNLKI